MLNKIKFYFQQSWLLIISSFAFGLLLAVTNAAWAPRIAKNQADKFNSLARTMLPDAQTFDTAINNKAITLTSGATEKITIKKAATLTGKTIGWAFTCKGPGFADTIKLVVAVDADFEKIKGFGVLSSNETVGFGDKIKDPYYNDQFINAPAVTLTLAKSGHPETIDNEIIAITGATVSSEAVVKIFNNYITQIKTTLQKEGLIK